MKKTFISKILLSVVIATLIITLSSCDFLFDGLSDNNDGINDDTAKNGTNKGNQTTQAQLSESEYKDLCKTYAYKELARNPENYKGEKIAMQGQVIQVLESGKNVEMRVNMNGQYEETVYIMYTLKSGEGRILENDIVNIYGTFEGLLTYESVLGAEITLPRIDAEYIEIVE